MAKFFIDRPIVAMVIAILMVIVGVVSILGLPTAQFPNIAPPEIQVQALYPGADAETLEQSVATPSPHRSSSQSPRHVRRSQGAPPSHSPAKPIMILNN